MKIVDLNVLLYALNEDAPHHRTVNRWWVQALQGDETIGLPWVVLNGFLRLATHPRVFPNPLTTAQATARIDTWLALPVIDVPVEKPGHWHTLRSVLAATGTAGNLVTDAHIATLALTRDAVVASCDHDFARFDKLRLVNPANG